MEEKGAGGASCGATEAPKAGVERIDIMLQKAGTDGYSQYVSSLTFAAHWCYWDNK